MDKMFSYEYVQGYTAALYSAIIYPDVYQVVVSYNNKEYIVNGKEIYYKYKHWIGEITNATIEKNSYDDGTIKYSVSVLE